MFQVYTFLHTEFVSHPVDDDLVEVVAAEVSVTVGAEHFEHAAAELQDGNIERTAAEVEDGNLHVLVSFVHTVSQSSSGRLVDNTLHV